MPDTPAKRKVTIEGEGPIPSVYANSTRLLFGLYDFRLVFAEQMLSRDGATVSQLDHVSIVMSPQHTKKLVKTMVAKITEYEEKFGQIQVEVEEENASPVADEA